MKALLIISAMFLLSCEKMNKTCYECDVTSRLSGQTDKMKVCTDDGQIPQFRDSNGNDMDAVCRVR